MTFQNLFPLVTVVIGAILAVLVLRAATRFPMPTVIRESMTVRLTVLHLDGRDVMRATHAYFHGADFTACRDRAALFLRDFSAGRPTHDYYRPFDGAREPRDIVGADLCDEFRGKFGETVSYAFQPGEWS